jgi:hypothetical protein
VGNTCDWDAEAELEILRSLPKAAPTKADNEKLAMQIFRDNLPVAAEIIGHLAANGLKESTQLAASKYIVERCLGRIPDAAANSTSGDMWEDLFTNVTREPTAEERRTGAKVSRL